MRHRTLWQRFALLPRRRRRGAWLLARIYLVVCCASPSERLTIYAGGVVAMVLAAFALGWLRLAVPASGMEEPVVIVGYTALGTFIGCVLGVLRVTPFHRRGP